MYRLSSSSCCSCYWCWRRWRSRDEQNELRQRMRNALWFSARRVLSQSSDFTLVTSHHVVIPATHVGLCWSASWRQLTTSSTSFHLHVCIYIYLLSMGHSDLRVRRWLRLRFDLDSTAVRLLIKVHWGHRVVAMAADTLTYLFM